MIYTLTISSILASLAFTVAFWPHFGLFTPIVLFTLFMGGISTLHFIPSF